MCASRATLFASFLRACLFFAFFLLFLHNPEVARGNVTTLCDCLLHKELECRFSDGKYTGDLCESRVIGIASARRPAVTTINDDGFIIPVEILRGFWSRRAAIFGN